MHLLLVGYFGLFLVNLSVALTTTLQVTQEPRFYGVKIYRSVMIFCVGTDRTRPAQVEWYKASKYNVMTEKRTRVAMGARISMKEKSLRFRGLETEDSGVYFCRMNKTWGPGTEIQVFRPNDIESAQGRNQMKDVLILIQIFLLAMCAAAPFLYKRTLLKKEETIYEEPEHDHIYEGLEIEHCGGGLYEDISVYAQPGEAEAVWEQD